MTYLETPWFGESEIVNNKQLHTLITIPKKYQIINDNIRIFTAIIMLPIILNILYLPQIKAHSLLGLLIIATMIFAITIYKIASKLRPDNKDNIVGSISDSIVNMFSRLMVMIPLLYIVDYIFVNDFLNKKVSEYINLLVLFAIGSIILCSIAYYMQILSTMFYIILFAVLIGDLFYGNWIKCLYILLVLIIQLIIRTSIFETSKIYQSIDFFLYEKNLINDSQDLLESKILVIKDILNKYIDHCEQNKIKVELIEIKPFINFIKDIYLKNSHESKENKAIIEDFLSIHNSKEERKK